MKITKNNLNNKGYLLIAVSITIILVLSTFLISYRIIINKQKRLSYCTTTQIYQDKLQFLDTFSIDEFYRMDKKISDGVYKNIVDYLGKSSDETRIWFKNSNESTGLENFTIDNMRFNNRIFYRRERDKNISFLKEIRMQLYFTFEPVNYLDIELMQRFKVSNLDKPIIITAIVRLEYLKGERNPYEIKNEYLKKMVIAFENN